MPTRKQLNDFNKHTNYYYTEINKFIKRDKTMEGKKETFLMKKDHITLLSKMYVGWQNCDFGAPEIDPKRPYGNSDVEMDIAKILELELFEDSGGEKHLSKEQYKMIVKLHKETETALQIVLSTQSFKEGLYELDQKYLSTSWKLVDL